MIERGCNPVIKWAGGKRQLLEEIISMMPEEYDTYYEPFFGGGALYFKLAPEKAVINDLNLYLVNFYKCLKDTPFPLLSMVNTLQETYNSKENDEEKKKYYYEIRDCFNQCIRDNDISCEQAAYFWFLNKACFNGIYRENSKGFFNVPTGRKKQLNIYKLENMIYVHNILNSTTILNVDFEKACENAHKGDFIFFDPPYYDTFSDYQKDGFTEDDQRKLAALFSELTRKKVKCMLTNSNTDFIKDLYKDYNIKVVSVKRMINRNGNDRTGEEVIITNYETGE